MNTTKTVKTATFLSVLAVSVSAGAAMAQMNNNDTMNGNNSYTATDEPRTANAQTGESGQMHSGQHNNMQHNRSGQNAQMNQQGQNGQQFSNYDRDDDNQLNNREFATYTFYTIDTNNDNRISEAEWDQYTNDWYDPIDLSYDSTNDFQDYDMDNDGYIETSEYGNAYDYDLFSSWDMDNDGFIETVEYDDRVNTYYDYDSDSVYVW